MERLRPWFDFRGRLSRLGFWRAYLRLTIISAIVAVVAMIASMAAGIWAAILFLPFVPIYVASIAMTVRRLHDRDRSAWWLVVFYLLPSGLIDAAYQLRDPTAQSLTVLLATLVGLGLVVWGVIEVGFLRGTPGYNRFGAMEFGPLATR